MMFEVDAAVSGMLPAALNLSGQGADGSKLEFGVGSALHDEPGADMGGGIGQVADEKNDAPCLVGGALDLSGDNVRIRGQHNYQSERTQVMQERKDLSEGETDLGSKKPSRLRLNKLGVVSYRDPSSGMCKRGLVLPDGKILGDRDPFIGDAPTNHLTGGVSRLAQDQDAGVGQEDLNQYETFENTIEWLEEAPFLQPEIDSAMERAGRLASEGIHRLELASENAMDAVYSGARGRRRSRSEIQGPGGDFGKESVYFLSSVDDEWNKWYGTQQEDRMGMAFDENEEEDDEDEEEEEEEEDDDEDDKFRKSDGLAGATHAAEGHHLTHHHFLSSIGTPDIDRQRTKSDPDDDLSNIMLASRLVFGTKCNRVCLYTESDPAILIADCIVRSVDSGLLHANRGESYWPAAVARAGTRLLISCETFLAQHNHSGTGLARGELVLTPAFDLPLRYILHAVTCTKDEQDKRMGVAELEATYRLIFERVQKENYQSLVLPFIGDASSSSAIDSATALVSVVMEACGADQDLFGLEKLVVACETSEELTALQSAIKTAASSKMTFQ